MRLKYKDSALFVWIGRTFLRNLSWTTHYRKEFRLDAWCVLCPSLYWRHTTRRIITKRQLPKFVQTDNVSLVKKRLGWVKLCSLLSLIFTEKNPNKYLFHVLKISLAITGMNAVCPVFFKLIAMIEQYHPRVALYWELTRYFNFVLFFQLFFLFNLESFRF